MTAKDLIDYLHFPLLDSERGVANLVYHSAKKSSDTAMLNHLDNVVFASKGEPLQRDHNRHPENNLGQSVESFSFMGGGIFVGNHWNGSITKNTHPTRDNLFDFPFANPCINLVLNRQNNQWCNLQWDDLWVEKDSSGNSLVLNSFQKYSPFFDPTTTLPTKSEIIQENVTTIDEYNNEANVSYSDKKLIDGASYVNRMSCLFLAAKESSPICHLNASSGCGSGYECISVVDKGNNYGYCLKGCNSNDDCGNDEQCMVAIGSKKVCKSSRCDTDFVSIVSTTITNATRPLSMAYMDDDFTVDKFDRLVNNDAISLRSTNAIIFNNVVEEYGHDTIYDLNQRGESIEDGITPRVINVKRNLFKNGKTKNTGASGLFIKSFIQTIFITTRRLVAIGHCLLRFGFIILSCFREMLVIIV